MPGKALEGSGNDEQERLCKPSPAKASLAFRKDNVRGCPVLSQDVDFLADEQAPWLNFQAEARLEPGRPAMSSPVTPSQAYFIRGPPAAKVQI